MPDQSKHKPISSIKKRTQMLQRQIIRLTVKGAQSLADYLVQDGGPSHQNGTAWKPLGSSHIHVGPHRPTFSATTGVAWRWTHQVGPHNPGYHPRCWTRVQIDWSSQLWALLQQAFVSAGTLWCERQHGTQLVKGASGLSSFPSSSVHSRRSTPMDREDLFVSKIIWQIDQ